MKICDKEKCFGCGACVAKCPVSCIKMALDSEGFDYPNINVSQCINCGMCKQVCPALNVPEKKEPITTYAAWIIDDKAHKNSTSGGLSDALMQTVIADGGVVCGAKMMDDFSVCHDIATTTDTAKAFKRSKYIQSRIGSTFSKVKDYLNQDKKVLFAGTPCQIAGLKKYIGDNDNLYLVDIVCHGTPAFESLKKHIEEIEEKNGKKADSMSYRDEDYKLILKQKGEVFYNKKSTEDLWYAGFLSGLFHKNACYTCPFAERTRVSDITIGDFWGLKDKTLEKSAKYGVSLMMINTKKGEQLCSSASNLLELHKRETDEAVNGNSQLRKPIKKHRNREKYFRFVNKKGFEVAAKKCLFMERSKYKVASGIYMMKKCVQKMKGH